ncbi:MAG: hypothetical protein M1838_003883 [Thelocarpon superellum]|nr:MAG: hypothetical protein M1838_003883 [Thelocarpon superellum]
MDVAYDHIQEEVIAPEEGAPKATTASTDAAPTLNAEFAEAYKAISSTPWGARFGALVGTVRKQGETYYEGARQEYSVASSQASKGFTEILNRTRSLSTKQPSSAQAADPVPETPTADADAAKDAPSSDTETLRESDGIISRFRSEASKRLKEIERAEDAADEALLKFGTNIRNFFRDAVAIAPPSEADQAAGKHGASTVLFESKDRDGKRVIHTTRFDAQLHVIHSTGDSFAKDPASPEYAGWREGFSVANQTDEIAKDLERFNELRAAMEQLVPDQVSYDDFWTRYYFLRHVVESEELRRKELLRRASVDPDEEVAWDEDSGPESPNDRPTGRSAVAKSPTSMNSSTTLHPTRAGADAATATAPSPKPAGSRRSHDQHSQPDSDASYDLVSGRTSGVPSQAPGSPPEPKKAATAEDSDEDWE